jgi:hypothetical protein
MATSSPPNLRFRRAAEKLRVSSRIRGRRTSERNASGEGRRLWITPVAGGFFVLVAMTTLAIASVSARWVPVYVILLATIFVVPRKRRAPVSVSERRPACDAVDITDAGLALRVDCAEGADQHRPLSRSDSEQSHGELAESSDASPDPASASKPKLRRSRARVRKAAAAAETGPVSVPVVWLQTGPGKFVRVEGGIQAAPSVEIESVGARANPATEFPAEGIEAESGQSALLTDENSSCSPGALSGEVEQGGVSDGCTSMSDSEEHGIAPAAFSLTSDFNGSAERTDASCSGQIQQSEGENGEQTEARGDLLGVIANSGHRKRQPGRLERWVVQAQRGLIRAGHFAGRLSRQRSIRVRRTTRSLARPGFAPNIPRRDAVRRAMGRVLQVQRSLRPRSPPRLCV